MSHSGQSLANCVAVAWVPLRATLTAGQQAKDGTLAHVAVSHHSDGSREWLPRQLGQPVPSLLGDGFVMLVKDAPALLTGVSIGALGHFPTRPFMVR